MKIDFLINSLTGGGAERVMTTLANGFSARANIVKLITFNANDSYEVVKSVKRIRLHYGNLSNHTIRSFVNLFKYYKGKKKRPDILISFMPKTNLVAIAVAKILKIKVIICEHSNHKAKTTSDTKWIRKFFYKYADATTVLTSYDISFYKALKSNVTVMPNPIILPESIKPFSERHNNILVAGSLNRYKLKGFDKLLYLMEPLLKSHSDWILTIAGSGENGMAILKKITKELNLEKQVKFTGFCKNIEELMQNSQIYILSSQYEGLPMVLMEALSNGMACISYNCVSGPSDLIVHNQNGLLVDNQNPKAMQEGVNLLIQNESLRKKLAANAPSSMVKYSLENILGQWELLINSVLSDGK
ncbi:group 1 glycosyl transferase [Maribacter sp. 4U21]|uniref:glycosyltransferase family 4 protein n=1 Tax=Maribacter sp. 4U21 TaxID=1889779 RepID=UPI000C158FBF|nr:glycosyltransferase family 4 protein [Maribacter sp. 4U21]PIB31197.1 group 1 glycosyl transferase [Maribacter sp. 4U21]